MTTNDYDARLARLNAATKGDTVTVPDGWEKPERDDASREVRTANLRPGDVFTNDGDDALEWKLDSAARTRRWNLTWHGSETLALLGLDVDDATAASTGNASGPTVHHEAADETGEAETQEDTASSVDEDDNEIGTVTVRVVPDTDGFVEAVEKAAAEAADAADAAGFHLDEYQRERVAALEQALRILESRRAPKGAKPGSLVAMLGKRAEVPMVGARDVVYVAAFIAEAETGAVGEAKA